MPEFRVWWQIDLEADSPEDAAEKALVIQRNPESIATVFTVGERVAMGKNEPIFHDRGEFDLGDHG